MYVGAIAWRLANTKSGGNPRGPQVKYGDEILEGPYPKDFMEFIGQPTARMQILASISSAAKRNVPVSHTLLASGTPGVGKTALARLTAHEMGKGFIELGGNVSDKDAVKALKVMQDGDVLFIDEIHRLVASGKSRAEWLLTLLQDNELHMPTGVVTAPLITIIAATTDREKLPQTILDRFPIQPVLLPYTIEEAIQIGALSAKRLGFGELIPMPEKMDWLTGIALASENNPRRMGNLLMSVRDIALATDLSNMHDDQYTLDEALTWNGLTADGLTRVAQDFLLALFSLGGTAGISSIKAMVGEEQVTQTERSLIQRGFVTITPRGRELTEYGEDRTRELAIEQAKVA